jgi:hypothetical protein
MSRARVMIATAVAIVASGSAYAQSLGDLARQEEARRAAVKTPAKARSNTDLPSHAIAMPPGPSGPSSPGAACYMSIGTGGCVTADEMIARSNAKIDGEIAKRREESWRRQADDIRGQLAKVQDEARDLATIVSNTRLSSEERASAARMLAQVQRTVVDKERRWAKFEEQAAAEQIPQKWLEPIPTISTRTRQ